MAFTLTLAPPRAPPTISRRRSPPPAALVGSSYRLPMQTASDPHSFYTRLLHFSSRIYMRLVPNYLPQSAGASCVIDEDQLTWSSLDALGRTLGLIGTRAIRSCFAAAEAFSARCKAARPVQRWRPRDDHWLAADCTIRRPRRIIDKSRRRLLGTGL
jgi:hypothetical protein